MSKLRRGLAIRWLGGPRHGGSGNARHGPGWTVAFVGLLVLALPVLASAQDRITQADLLRRVIDLQRLTTPPPAGERTALFSSSDRRAQADFAAALADGGADEDCGHFLRRDEDGWDVLAEVQGPGAVTRIWSANPQGQIRLVLDGEVVIDTSFAALLDGNMQPFAEPLVYDRRNCYFPIGFGRSCRIVGRECQSYYQINTIQFPPGSQVERFRTELDEAAQAALADVKHTLEEGLSDKQIFGSQRTLPVAVQQDLGPGEVLSESLNKAGTVRALYIALTDRTNPRDLYALHHCILRIYADGEKTPSVEAPLCDFFGAGFDWVPVQTLVVGTDRSLPIPLPDRRTGEDRFMYCLFPMPYRDGLRIEIENRSDAKKKIGLLLHLRVDTRPPARDALRFYARFRREDPCRGPEYPVLDTSGRGRVVGCVLDVDCPRAGWWGAGDDKIWIDGEESPAYFGTGTGDYFGDTGPLHTHIRPFQGVTRSGPYGKNSAYRWQIADCVNFHRSVRFNFENWQERGLKDTYFGSSAYWYGEPGAKQFFKPLELADVTPPGLRIPGAIEIESNMVGSDWGQAVKQKYADGAELSGKEAASITTDQPVQINIPSDTARTVVLKLRVNPRRAFETVTVTDATGRAIGTVSYDRSSDGLYTVGLVTLEGGNNPVKVQCTRPAVLDCWVLETPPTTTGPGPEN